MESLLHSSVKIVAPTLPKLQIKSGFFGDQLSFSVFPQQNSCLGRRKLLIVEAKKNKNNDNKQDSHSFIPKLDETTGFFPEAVLLKEVSVMHKPFSPFYVFFLRVFITLQYLLGYISNYLSLAKIEFFLFFCFSKKKRPTLSHCELPLFHVLFLCSI